ncbi:MAG: hypothetical protein P1U44_10895 [Vicingaceae bacterium]|nr:hypothetical protein [Vicingaceae bacterium]
MKRIFTTSLLSVLFFPFFLSCGISKEVRTASTNLVTKQKTSLEAHQTFHHVILIAFNEVLDAEIARSQKTYEESLENYHQAMLDELKNIYENEKLSEAEKKVREETARQKIMNYIKTAEENKKKRDQDLNEAKSKLATASNFLLEGEKAKADAIEKLDAYLQAKRPSERLLEQIDLDLNQYKDYISKANQAIKEAEPFINKLND